MLPDPETDIAGEDPTPSTVPGQEGWLIPHESLHGASWRAALLRLDGLGWELMQGEEEDATPLDSYGWPSHQLGWTQDGRTVLALYRPNNHPATLADFEVSLVGLALELGFLVRWAVFNMRH